MLINGGPLVYVHKCMHAVFSISQMVTFMDGVLCKGVLRGIAYHRSICFATLRPFNTNQAATTFFSLKVLLSEGGMEHVQ